MPRSESLWSTWPPPNTSGPGCSLRDAPGLQAIATAREGVSPVRPAAELHRWCAKRSLALLPGWKSLVNKA
jgi:hypothetical protein